MKYFIRSVKFFFYFAFMTTAIILVLVFIGAAEGGIENIFEDGWNAIWKIAVIFAAIAAIYPKFKFITRGIATEAGWEQVRNQSVTYFKERGLDLETETSYQLTFRRRSVAARISRMGEDRIILSHTAEGYTLNGPSKDVTLFTTGLETILG